MNTCLAIEHRITALERAIEEAERTEEKEIVK